MILEACVDSVAGAKAAQEGGAGRLELCSALDVGGLTPSLGLQETVRDAVEIPVHVLIRPRPGDFCYTADEILAMQRDIVHARRAGAQGLVMGALTPEGHIDRAHLRSLLEAAGAGEGQATVTFHRAFDMVAAATPALETLIDLGVDRLLTAGRAPTAQLGIETLADLVEQAQGRIRIMAGGGLDAGHIAEVVRATGVQELHMSGRVTRPSAMRYRNVRLHAAAGSGEFGAGESGAAGWAYDYTVTSADRIRAALDALDRA